jgi:hypothetical protein
MLEPVAVVKVLVVEQRREGVDVLHLLEALLDEGCRVVDEILG